MENCSNIFSTVSNLAFWHFQIFACSTFAQISDTILARLREMEQQTDIGGEERQAQEVVWNCNHEYPIPCLGFPLSNFNLCY